MESQVSKEVSNISKKDKGDSPIGSSHLDMKTYNENDFSDSGIPRIDIDTGEAEKPAPKDGNRKWQNFVAYWQKKCLEAKGVEDVEVVLKKDKPIYHRVKKLYTNDQIAEIIEFFLASQKSKEFLTISACFSAHTINQWKQSNRSLL